MGIILNCLGPLNPRPAVEAKGRETPPTMQLAPLTYMMVRDPITGKTIKVKRKKFYDGRAYVCTFCKQSAHTYQFCPSRPTEPPEEEQIPFVERLLRSPQVKTAIFGGLTWSEALQRVTKEGERLNSGNPWLLDNGPGSALRKGLGFWKAIGASRSVLSWIGYGFEFRFVRQPKRLLFANSMS
jgi:hypothetical protein